MHRLTETDKLELIAKFPEFYEQCGRLHPFKAKPRKKGEPKKQRNCIKCSHKKPVDGFFMCSQCQRDAQRAPALYTKALAPTPKIH